MCISYIGVVHELEGQNDPGRGTNWDMDFLNISISLIYGMAHNKAYMSSFFYEITLQWGALKATMAKLLGKT